MSKVARAPLVWVVLAQHALQPIAPMIPACKQTIMRKLVGKVAGARLVWVVLAQHTLQPVASMVPACRQTLYEMPMSKVARVLLAHRLYCHQLHPYFLHTCRPRC